MFAGILLLIVGIIAFVAGSVFTLHSTFLEAVGFALFKLILRITGIILLLFSVYSCGNAIGL